MQDQIEVRHAGSYLLAATADGQKVQAEVNQDKHTIRDEDSTALITPLKLPTLLIMTFHMAKWLYGLLELVFKVAKFFKKLNEELVVQRTFV